MNILIDIGGSGIKMTSYSMGEFGAIERYSNIDSFDSFVGLIHKKCGKDRLSGLAISTAGFVVAEEGRVIKCKCAPYLEGNIVRKLQNEFPSARIAVINDGEAHARALLVPRRNVRFGAIHLAFGTSVAFGVINNKREIVRTCSGENWDIGDYLLRTREKPYEVWYKLGSDGLRDLENNLRSDPYYHFGLRAGGLLTNLAVVFRPKTIGMSGGIISTHGKQILAGIRDEFRPPVLSEPIDFVLLSEQETAMEGLTTLL